MYEIHRKTGARIHIAHLKMSGKKQWGRTDELVRNIREARQSGIPVTADMYPYRAASSGITNVFPKWTLEGGVEKAAERLLSSDRGKIIAYLAENYQTKADGEGLRIVTTYGRYPAADGRNIYQLSRELNLSMADTIAKVTMETHGHASCIMFAMAEADVMDLLGRDIAIGSDGSGIPLEPDKNKGKPHPRNYGTFPRFLRLAREKNLCPLETAVFRMTKKSADIVGLKDRGVLRPGLAADITVFDPARIADRATYENPFQRCDGIEHVIVNGKPAVYAGDQTDNRPGKFLLKR